MQYKFNTAFFSPARKKLSHPANRRKLNKICNLYKITDVTLENFGLSSKKNPAVKRQGVGRNDKMNISTPEENKKEAAEKPFSCKFCGSENFIKYGKKNGKQNYFCKNCKRKFVNNLYFKRLKADPKIICVTLDLYFKGMSLRKICDHFEQFYDLKVVHTTVLRWIEKYVEIMTKYVSQFKPKLGSVWQVDEMMVDIDGNWFYLWNVMDEFTRFHLASVISKERKIKDARKAFQQAKKRSHNDRPRVGIKGKHFKNTKFDNNLVERLHGTVRDRNKTQRGLKSEETTFVKGHQLYYNFIKPHETLNGYTPAHFANIYLSLGNKKWENLLMQSVKNQKNKE
jgi:transposase-like protein